jgi:RNA polymerase sigma-70 factor (ECF subfamily)
MDNDVKLIEGCMAGKRKAHSELYKRYSPLLYGISLRYAASTFDAQEILQESFIKIFGSIHAFEGKGSFEGWIKRITVNTALNHIRAAAAKPLFDQVQMADQIPDEIPVEPESMQLPDAEVMLALVQELPDGYRLVFNLYVFENYAHKEIAEKLGISENTSKTQLMRARIHLQKKLNAYSA